MHHFPALCIICLWLHHLLASCIIIPKLHHTSASCIIPLHHASFVCIMHHKLPSYYSRNYPESIDLGSLKRSKTARNNPKVICFDLLKRSKTARNDPKVIGPTQTFKNSSKLYKSHRLWQTQTFKNSSKRPKNHWLWPTQTFKNSSKWLKSHRLGPTQTFKNVHFVSSLTMSLSWYDNLVTNGVPEVPKLSYRCVPEGSCLALPSTAFRLELVQKSLFVGLRSVVPHSLANSSPLGEHTRVTSHKHTPDHNALLSNARTGAQRMSYAVTGVGRCSCESDPHLAR